jgi:hypothetical protein
VFTARYGLDLHMYFKLLSARKSGFDTSQSVGFVLGKEAKGKFLSR